jgi:hypothetical protein
MQGAALLASARNLVGHVLGLRPFNQMRVVATRWIVARMPKSRDRPASVFELERDVMGRAQLSIDAHMAVAAVTHCRAGPRPAFIWPANIDVAPEVRPT